MSQDRASWPAIVGGAVLGGVVAYFGFVLIDVLFGDEPRWGFTAVLAGVLVVIWTAIGAATRAGWVPPNQRRKRQ